MRMAARLVEPTVCLRVAVRAASMVYPSVALSAAPTGECSVVCWVALRAVLTALLTVVHSVADWVVHLVDKMAENWAAMKVASSAGH